MVLLRACLDSVGEISDKSILKGRMMPVTGRVHDSIARISLWIPWHDQKQQRLRECRSYENSVGRKILTASLIDFLTISCASGGSKGLGKLHVAFMYYVLHVTA